MRLNQVSVALACGDQLIFNLRTYTVSFRRRCEPLLTKSGDDKISLSSIVSFDDCVELARLVAHLYDTGVKLAFRSDDVCIFELT